MNSTWMLCLQGPGIMEAGSLSDGATVGLKVITQTWLVKISVGKQYKELATTVKQLIQPLWKLYNILKRSHSSC